MSAHGLVSLWIQGHLLNNLKSMQFNDVVGCWTERVVKLLGIWFGLVPQMEN